MSIDEFVGEAADDLCEDVAAQLVQQLRTTVSIPGLRGTRATPGAPPRKVTGRLQRSINRRRSTVYVGAPYAVYLEDSDHKFIEPTLKAMGLL